MLRIRITAGAVISSNLKSLMPLLSHHSNLAAFRVDHKSISIFSRERTVTIDKSQSI